MRVPNVGQAAFNLAGVRFRRAQRYWRTAAAMFGRVGKHIGRQAEFIVRAPSLARARVAQGRAAVERTQKRLQRFDDHVLTPFRMERQVMGALLHASAGTGPVIVGPWTSEVGYEALYWIPFLRRAVDRYGLRPDRVIAISRGGTGAWYEGIAGRYVEIFDLIPPDEFARQTAARRESGDQKQMAPSAFDRDLVARASERLGVRDATLWHPGLMYQLFRPFWHGDRSLEFLFRHADFRRSSHADHSAPVPGLPADYAAVKFYTGPALPDSEENRGLLVDLVRRLAARMPVVLLDTAWTVDEHRDYVLDGIPGVITLRPSLDPGTNLGVQTRVIAGARQFVGTCGGLAWLAPLMGVDTLAVYADDRFLTAHLYAAKYAYRRAQAARFSTLNLKALRRLRAA
jgi:hypothetical protein